MLRMSFLLESALTSQTSSKEFICILAKKWTHEFARLCQPMKNSPSTLHSLVNLAEEDLPSSVLLQNGLLLNELGQVQTSEQYDRKAYVELNRGMSSAIALFHILRGDCYEELVEGQKKEIILTKENYLQLHEQFKNLFLKDGAWNEELLETIFYAVLFNDLGKNLELKRILHDLHQVKDNDHDLILRHAFQVDGLLKDFAKFTPSQQRCLLAMWHSGFNPSSFDTLEYPLSMIVHWIMSFANIAKENLSLYLAMKKIEILTDIAGVNGNTSKGATNLTDPVVEKFNNSFEILRQLFVVYQEQLDSGVTENTVIYNAVMQKLEALSLEHAVRLGITIADELTPKSVLQLRLCKMLGLNDSTQAHLVTSMLKKIEQEHPDDYKILEQEFSWKQDSAQPILWMACIPKFMWLMSNGNNYDLLGADSLSRSALRRENGLYASLLMVSRIFKKIRSNNKYEELYTFENNELIKLSPDTIAAEPSIALFVAYDLVRMAQQVSELNRDAQARQEAIHCLKTLWEHGALIEGQYITAAKPQQRWLTQLTEETNAHCAYLTSIGLADRVSYFKVKPFIYQDYTPETIDISRFSHTMALPDIVQTFDPREKNTLFTNPDSSESDQEQEIKRTLDIRLYPVIRQLIAEKRTTIFLGAKTELQAYTKSHQEELIVEIEIPSSVKFYLTLDKSGQLKVYIGNLVSHENLIQQLITLKIAGLDLADIPILGDTRYYQLACKEDVSAFAKQSTSYMTRKNVLIVAGCSLEETICSTLEQIFNDKATKHKFSGQVVSLTHLQSQHAPHLGFILLNLNYGEICEEQISLILEKFNCIGIFSGSAAGYIPKEGEEKLPDIGTRVAISTAKHHTGELVTLDKEHSGLHLHVPTIFVETFDWLKNAAEQGASTVDIETFYILRAIQRYQQANSQAKINTDIGVFISDYVGKKPLRHYQEVFAHYPAVLHSFIMKVLVANLTTPYSSNRTSIPSFASEYFSLEPEKIDINPAIKKEPVVDCIGKFWDKTEFSKRVHTPVTIGTVKDRENFTAQDAPRCIHLPILFPGSKSKIPKEYLHFAPILQQIINFEASINPRYNELYAYLTVDRGIVPRSNFQRVPGPHVDGIPRNRDNPETELVDHAYLVTDAIPTTFYPQQFDMDPYDPNLHHFFAIFRALADESRTITATPFEIILMNAYSVHTPTENEGEDVNRTFLRLEWSRCQFDRFGNSINPHFAKDEQFPNYPFNYIPRPIPKHLFVPPDVYLNKPITNEDYSHESIDVFGRANLQAMFLYSEKVRFNHSSYTDLSLIAKNMREDKIHGLVFTHQGLPHAFCLYKIENKTIQLTTLFRLMDSQGKEMMIYQMKILKQLADRLAVQAGLEEGATPITILVDENNKNMLHHFLRAARLAKVEVNIESDLQKNTKKCYSLKELCFLTIHARGIQWENAGLSVELEHELKSNSRSFKG